MSQNNSLLFSSVDNESPPGDSNAHASEWLLTPRGVPPHLLFGEVTPNSIANWNPSVSSDSAAKIAKEYFRDKKEILISDDVAFPSKHDICDILFATDLRGSPVRSTFVPNTFRGIEWGTEVVPSVWCPNLSAKWEEHIKQYPSLIPTWDEHSSTLGSLILANKLQIVSRGDSWGNSFSPSGDAIIEETEPNPQKWHKVFTPGESSDIAKLFKIVFFKVLNPETDKEEFRFAGFFQGVRQTTEIVKVRKGYDKKGTPCFLQDDNGQEVTVPVVNLYKRISTRFPMIRKW